MAIDKSKMKCNSPKRQVQGGKKFVVKACKDGKEKIIRFGDANMTIKNAVQLQDTTHILMKLTLLRCSSRSKHLHAISTHNTAQATPATVNSD